MPPVCHTLISLPFLLPLCSAAPLSLSLSLPCPTAVTLFCFLALLLSRFWFCSHLPPWCASPPEKTSDLSSQFLVLSLGFCCTPMWPRPPPPPTVQIRNSRTAPPSGGRTHKNTHTFRKTWHAFVLMSVWEHTCGSFCAWGQVLCPGMSLCFTHTKSRQSQPLFKEERKSRAAPLRKVCAHTHTHTLIFPHFLCSVIWSYMHSQEWAGLT